MPLDANIYQQLDTQAPMRLAAVLDPAVQDQRRLQSAQRQAEMQGMERKSRLQKLLGQGGDPEQLAQTLMQSGYLDEATKVRSMADSASMRRDQELERRNKLIREAHGQVGAMGGSDEAIRQVYGSLPFIGEEGLAKIMQHAATIPPESRQGYFLSLSNPELYSKQQEAAQARKDRADEAAISRQSRMDELKMRMADSRLQAADRMALQRELALMRLEAQKNATDAKNAPKEAAAQTQREQQSISAQQAIDQAEKLFSHPGRKIGTGMSSFMGMVPGTNAKDFQANLDTFKAQTFVPMVAALKGMGALSDAEGKKLTDAVGALNPQMTEKGFEDSLREVTRTLFNKAKAAGLNVSLPTFANQVEPAQARPSAPSRAPSASGELSPQEQAELEALRKRFKKP